MSIQVERGSPDKVFPVGFCLSRQDHERAKRVARQNQKSFAEYVRGLVLQDIGVAQELNH